MTETESRRVDAVAASEENRLAIAVELARRQALGDTDLHLAVDIENGLLYLERHGARLREMRVHLGREATVGAPPDAVLLAPPLGKRSVAQVVDGSHPWEVPEWVYVDRGWSAPDDRPLEGSPELLSAVASMLARASDDGSIGGFEGGPFRVKRPPRLLRGRADLGTSGRGRGQRRLDVRFASSRHASFA